MLGQLGMQKKKKMNLDFHFILYKKINSQQIGPCYVHENSIFFSYMIQWSRIKTTRWKLQGEKTKTQEKEELHNQIRRCSNLHTWDSKMGRLTLWQKAGHQV